MKRGKKKKEKKRRKIKKGKKKKDNYEPLVVWTVHYSDLLAVDKEKCEAM